MHEFYYKKGRKYVRAYETPQMFSNGIWLVQEEPTNKSKQLILKIGELKELYPYAQMAQDLNELASFLCYWKNSKVKETIVNRNGEITYTLGSATEQAEDILKFLAMGKEERKDWISKLR
jgi:hypothetical protein